MSGKNVLLLEPFKKIPPSNDPLDNEMLVHFGILKAISRDLKESYIEKKIASYDFEVAGLSIGDPYSASEGIRYARIIKKINPNVLVIMGGMQPTFYPNEFLKDDSVDYVIRGAGESAFPALVKMILNNDGNPSKIAGVCSKNAIRSDFADKIPPHKLPPIDFEALRVSEYMKKNPFANIQTSRGCPYNCPFCLHAKFWGLKPEFRTIENLKVEIKCLQDHGCKMGYITDSAFTLDLKHVEKVCDMLEDIGNEIFWGFETRADQVNLSMLKKCNDVNIILTWFGAESGSKTVLKNLRGKNQGGGGEHLDNLRKATVIASKAGLIVGSSWIIGLPGETWNTVRETIDFMKELIDLGMDVIDPRTLALFPGTEYYLYPEKYGLIIEDNLEEAQQFHAKAVACRTEGMTAKEIVEALKLVKKEVLTKYKSLAA
ncbi:MAG: B12-binding domain-containing radical SAM protein [Promethearchaeota archaeon]